MLNRCYLLARCVHFWHYYVSRLFPSFGEHFPRFCDARSIFVQAILFFAWNEVCAYLRRKKIEDCSCCIGKILVKMSNEIKRDNNLSVQGKKGKRVKSTGRPHCVVSLSLCVR